ncbi:MAG TPA: phosphatase PAP2-related protein [Saprospiraceae bacterium]|nr:phosphatase PAP2-related protein [Saprospiraceae bacterium]
MSDTYSDWTWRELWRHRRARWYVAFCLVSLLMVIFYLPYYYGEVIEPKPGILWNDAVLDLFAPVNWSVFIFSIIYLSILLTVISIANKPGLLLVGATTYFLVSILRMVSMYVLTLEPPAGMVLLIDPITSNFYPDHGFAKDLFFSGHVSTMMLLVLVEKKRLFRYAKIIGTVVVGLLLAWQHVHYTLDLLVAPVVTFLVFSAVKSGLEQPKMG